MKKTITVEMAAGGYLGEEMFFATVKLPAKNYEIQDALQKLRINSNRVENPRMEVCCCEILPELTDVRLESPSIQEMNFLAQRLAQLPDNEAIALRGVWKRLEKEGLVCTAHICKRPICLNFENRIAFSPQTVPNMYMR